MSSDLKKKKKLGDQAMEEEKLEDQAMEEKKCGASHDCSDYVEEKHENNNHHQEEEEEEIVIGDGGYCIDNFPPGYRFRPTDEELVKYYLIPKIDNKPLPHDKIQEVFLYQKTPAQLTDENRELGEEEWYFFTPRERKYKLGKRPNRKAGDGYWKATGADKKITYKGKLIGFKKSLVFYEGKPPRGNKSDWIMHEYIANRPIRNKLHENDMRLDDWVLCRLKKKPESANKPRFMGHNVVDADPVTSSEEENPPPFSHNNQLAVVNTNSIGGHGGLTALLANTYGIPQQALPYNPHVMDFNYEGQPNVYMPQLEYPMGTNSNISHYFCTPITYGHTSNYHTEHFDAEEMFSTNYDCEAQSAHPNVMNPDATYMLEQEWANEDLSELARLDTSLESTRLDYNLDGSLR